MNERQDIKRMPFLRLRSLSDCHERLRKPQMETNFQQFCISKEEHSIMPGDLEDSPIARSNS